MANEVRITALDTTPAPLDSKVLIEDGLKKRVANPAGNETLVLGLDVIGLPLSTTATIADDYIPFYSESLEQNRRMTLVKLGELISAEIDVKDFYVSEDDSTPGFLFDKISIPAGYGLAKTITNPNANELLRLVLDIESLATITTYDADNTYMVVYDTTEADGIPKKLLLPVGSDLSNLPTGEQKAALAGTYGTPSGSNEYVTDSDPRMSGLTTTVSGSGVAGETIVVGNSLFEEQPIAFANTLSEMKLGDVNANKRIAVRAFGSGVSSKYFNIAINNVVSPSALVGFRIETDSGGSPSGTLVHANAVATLDPATLSANYADTTTNTSITTFGSASTSAFGHRIQSLWNQKLISVTKGGSSQSTRAILKTDTGNTTIATATFSGNTATFGTDAQMIQGTYYRIEFDASGSNHTYGNGGSHSTVTDTNITILNPSVNGADSGSNALEIVSINTDNVVLDTRITCTDNFSVTRGTPIWIVMFVGTYTSETVNATNHFKIGYSTNLSNTRYEKLFNTSYASTTNKSVYIGNPSSNTGDGVITSMSYSGFSKAISSVTSNCQGLFFSSDGTKMYISDANTIYQLALSTAWAVNTAVYSSVFVGVGSQESNLKDYYISPDGTKLYIVGINQNTVYQYNLGTAWNISTAVYASKSKSVSAQEANTNAVHFSSDGTRMFICGTTSDTVFKYTLGTAWDVSTASYASNSINVNAQDPNPIGIFFNSTGTKMYILGQGNLRVYEYELTTAWDLSTAAYTSRSFLVSSQDNDTNAIYFDADFFRMYTAGNNTNYIFQYTLSGRAYTYYDALLESNILALTDADYTYRLPQIPRISQQNKTAGQICQYSLQGVVTMLTPLIQNSTYYTSNTPGSISTSAGTNTSRIGVAIGLYQLFLMPLIPFIKPTTTGLSMGVTYTATSDGIVNANVTNSGAGQTFIGTSNGVVLASVNGAPTGTAQYSICFPVRAGTTWSVTGTMPTSPTVFFTPFS